MHSPARSREIARALRHGIPNILRKMQILLEVWPRGIARVNPCSSVSACARYVGIYIYMYACVCSYTYTHQRIGIPPHLFVFRSRMPVRKLRRLRQNPRRRHRDFRRRFALSSIPRPSIKAPAIRRLMFQVGWVKADTKAIQAIHDHVITHNQRVSVSHSDHTMWNLHIKGVQKEDGGLYMCQINTDPMKSQVC